MSKKRSIAEDLRQAIAHAERKGMTRYAIAKAAKLQRSQLTRIATGETVPTLDTAQKIADVIGVTIHVSKMVAKNTRKG